MTRPSPAPARRRPLRRGMTVWLWYAGVISRGTLLRRGTYALRKLWRVSIYACGDTHHARRRDLFLSPEDALNYAR